MSAACEMGGLLTGEDRYRDVLARFGHHLGMAFQIADDILDYTGTEEVTGKPTGHDLRERKVTLPLVGALAGASRAETRAIESFFTLVDPSDDAIHEVVEIVRGRGGVRFARERAEGYAERASEALDDLPAGPALDALGAAIDYAIDRSR